MNMISLLRRRVQEAPEEEVRLSRDEFNLLQGEWIKRVMPWIDVDVELPAIGQPVLVFGNGVVQNETYYLSEADESDYYTTYITYFWDRDDLGEGIPITKWQMWMPLPSCPKAG